MWLLDKMLRRLVRRGELTVIDHDGKEYRYGAPDPQSRSDHGPADRQGRRLPYRRAIRGSAPARPIWTGGSSSSTGDIRDLILLIRYNAPCERPGALKPKGPVRKAAAGKSPAGSTRSTGRPARARNAEHTYNLTRRLYELFLDEDRQYTCAYYRDPSNSLEQAQLDKKAHIAAKLNLKPGMKVLDIGCGWGGLALYLHRHYDVDVLGVALAPDQIEFCQRARRRGRRLRPGQVRADGLSRRRGPVRPDHQRRPDRASRHAALSRPSSPNARAAEPDGVMFSHCCGRMGEPRHHRQMDPQIYLPGRLHPGAVGARHRGGKAPADRHRRRGAALPLRPHARGMVPAHRRRPRGDHRALRRALLPHVAILPGRRRGGVPLWRPGQLADPVCQAPRRDPDDPRLMFEEEERLRGLEEPPEWHLAAE